jgi:hypothetical protein
MEAVDGVTVMLVMVAAVTVRAAVPEVLPEVAVIVDVPAATPVARPAPEIVAAAVLLLDHVTDDEQLPVVLFEYVQVAANCCVPEPATIEAVAGVTEIPVMVGPVTVRAAVPDTLPEVALIVDEPAAAPVARPALEMVAAAVLLLDQVTVEVQFDVVLFE